MKKIRAKAFKEYIDDNYNNTVVETIDGVDVEIKRHLRLAEMISFVNSVVEGCFQNNEEGNTTTFEPELKDMIIRSELVTRYTNVELPKNYSDQYDFLYETDIVRVIVDTINKNEFNNMLEAIDLKISNEAEARVNILQKQIETIYSAIDNISNQLIDVFGELTPDDMKAFLKSFNEESLAKALLNARNGENE